VCIYGSEHVCVCVCIINKPINIHTHIHTHTHTYIHTHTQTNTQKRHSFLITCYKHGAYTPAIFSITEATVIPVNILWYLRQFRTHLPNTHTHTGSNKLRIFETVWMFVRMISYVILRPLMAPFLVWYAAKHFGDRVGMPLYLLFFCLSSLSLSLSLCAYSPSIHMYVLLLLLFIIVTHQKAYT